MGKIQPSEIRAINQKASNDSGVRSNFFYGNLLEQKRYIFVLNYIRNLDVLDCASGIGWGSFLMAQAGARRVVGVELSQSAVLTARKYYSCKNVEFVNSAIEDASVCEGLFDVVVSFETLEHVSNPTSFLKKLRLIARKNATLFLSTPNGRAFKLSGDAAYNPYHLEEYTREDLERMFMDSDWSVVEYRGQYPMKSDSIELEKYRKFIRGYWHQQKLRRRLGLPYRVVAFLNRKMGFEMVEPAFSGDCNPVVIEKGYEPAYHYFILRAL